MQSIEKRNRHSVLTQEAGLRAQSRARSNSSRVPETDVAQLSPMASSPWAALKGHGFGRADRRSQTRPALAAEGVRAVENASLGG